MYKNQSLQLCRTTNGIKPRSGALEEALSMIFVIILEVTGILCCFRVVLEEKADKENLE